MNTHQSKHLQEKKPQVFDAQSKENSPPQGICLVLRHQHLCPVVSHQGSTHLQTLSLSGSCHSLGMRHQHEVPRAGRCHVRTGWAEENKFKFLSGKCRNWSHNKWMRVEMKVLLQIILCLLVTLFFNSELKLILALSREILFLSQSSHGLQAGCLHTVYYVLALVCP